MLAALAQTNSEHLTSVRDERKWKESANWMWKKTEKRTGKRKVVFVRIAHCMQCAVSWANYTSLYNKIFSNYKRKCSCTLPFRTLYSNSHLAVQFGRRTLHCTFSFTIKNFYDSTSVLVSLPEEMKRSGPNIHVGCILAFCLFLFSVSFSGFFKFDFGATQKAVKANDIRLKLQFRWESNTQLFSLWPMFL